MKINLISPGQQRSKSLKTGFNWFFLLWTLIVYPLAYFYVASVQFLFFGYEHLSHGGSSVVISSITQLISAMPILIMGLVIEFLAICSLGFLVSVLLLQGFKNYLIFVILIYFSYWLYLLFFSYRNVILQHLFHGYRVSENDSVFEKLFPIGDGLKRSIHLSYFISFLLFLIPLIFSLFLIRGSDQLESAADPIAQLEIKESKISEYHFQVLLGMVGDDIYQFLLKNKNQLKIQGNEAMMVDKFLNDLKSYGVAEVRRLSDSYLIGENMMPRSAGLMLTYFIDVQTGNTFYFKYSDCLGVSVGGCGIIELNGGSGLAENVDRLPLEIHEWLKIKLEEGYVLK